jgi:hypothetical protein
MPSKLTFGTTQCELEMAELAHRVATSLYHPNAVEVGATTEF